MAIILRKYNYKMRNLRNLRNFLSNVIQDWLTSQGKFLKFLKFLTI